MSGAAGDVLIGIAALVGLFVIAANLLATVALVRTTSLTRFQKVAQGVIVWVLPLLGAFLVLHLIGQSDRVAIEEWIPDTAINRYVFELLGIEGKVAERAAEQVVEQAIIHTISEHMSHQGSDGETGGSDGGH
jgi:carbon starvation protein CstA